MSMSGKQWNQGNLHRNAFVAPRKCATHSVLIDAPEGRLFGAACLAGPPGWLPAGAVHGLYSETGHNEKNALWLESETGPAVFRRPGLQTFWTTTRIDPKSHRLQAALINLELAMGTLDVEMEEQEDGTVVRFDLSYTALSETGSALFDGEIDRRLGRLLEHFGRMLADSLTAGPALPLMAGSHQTQRRSVEHEITMSGDIDECFALACPVAELLWIDGWKFDLIYSESGRNETGCVFLEPSTGLSMLCSPGANTYWYSTRYDTEEHQFEAVWLTRDLAVARWELGMTDLGGEQTRVNWRLIYTGLGEEGSCIIGEPGLERRMLNGLSFLATALKHYVETGSIYRLSSWRKLRLATSVIGASLRRHFRRGRAGHGSASPPGK